LKREADKEAQASSRTKLTKMRAKAAGKFPEDQPIAVMWTKYSPWRKTMLTSNLKRPTKTKKALHDQVTPGAAREAEVRLGMQQELECDASEDDHI